MNHSENDFFALHINTQKVQTLKWLALFVGISSFIILMLSYQITAWTPFQSSAVQSAIFPLQVCLGAAQILCAGHIVYSILRMTVGTLLDMRGVVDENLPLFSHLFQSRSDCQYSFEQNNPRAQIAKTLALTMSTKAGCKLLESGGPYVNCCLVATAIFNITKTGGTICAFGLVIALFSLMYLRHQLRTKYQNAVFYQGENLIWTIFQNEVTGLKGE